MLYLHSVKTVQTRMGKHRLVVMYGMTHSCQIQHRTQVVQVKGLPQFWQAQRVSARQAKSGVGAQLWSGLIKLWSGT